MIKVLKTKDISAVREELLEKQEHQCGICGEDLRDEENTNKHLDHNHDDGYVRGVLCRRCNLLEGTLYYRFRRSGHVRLETDYIIWLEQHLAYLKRPSTIYEHPAHKQKKATKFKNMNKNDQLKELSNLEIIPKGKVTKKDLLKLFKKAI